MNGSLGETAEPKIFFTSGYMTTLVETSSSATTAIMVALGVLVPTWNGFKCGHTRCTSWVKRMFAMTDIDAKMAKTKTMIIFKTGVRAGGVWVFSIDAEEQDTEVTVVGGAVVTVGMVNFAIAVDRIGGKIF